MRKAVASCLVLVALVPAAIAAGPAEVDSAGRVLRIVLPRAPSGLDPHLEPTAVADAILGNVFEGLLEIADDGTPTPVLAVSWERKSDRQWKVTLRQGVRFHNGLPLTTEDVAASIERARTHPESVSRVLLAAIDRTVAEDAETLRIELNRPDAVLLQKVATVAIVPADAPDRIVDPVGTGPYRLDPGEPVGPLTFRAFPDYWGSSGGVDVAEVSFEENRRASLERLRRGEVDIVTGLPPELVDPVEQSDDLWVESALGGLVYVLALNANKAPFDDPIVREAVAVAIDRHALAREVFLDYCRAAGQLVNETSYGYAPHVKPVERNLTRARALATAAAERPVRFTVELKEGNETLGAAVKRQANEAGIAVELQSRPWNELLPRILDGEVQATIFTWRSTHQDAGFLFDLVLHSASPIHAPLGYSSPEIDRLVTACQTTLEPEMRRELLYSVARRVAEQRALLPLVWGMDLYGVRRDVVWRPTNSGTIDLQNITRRPR